MDIDQSSLKWKLFLNFRTSFFPHNHHSKESTVALFALQDTKEFIQAVDELLPLARAGLDGCLIPVRMAFIDSIGIAFKNFHLHCVSVCIRVY